MRILTFLFLWVASFTYGQNNPKAKQFLEQFKVLEGKYFEGEIVAGGKEGDGFVGQKLIMHVKSYSDREVRIPFYVGEDKSRTWILAYTNHVLTLKHDHRNVDGTPDKETFYGGTANNSGSANMQMFPADQETCEMIDYACYNVWWITMDGKIFTYNLRRIGTDRLFTVKFDLTKPISSNYQPW